MIIESNNDNGKTSESVIVQILNPFSANFTKWSITLKQFVGNLPSNCVSVFDPFVGLALNLLRRCKIS